MGSNRSPDIRYNGSGYVDLTASDAISNIHRAELKARRRRVMDKFYRIAADENLEIASYIYLIDKDRS